MKFKIMNISPAEVGPRGGLQLRASVSIEAEDGTKIYLTANTPYSQPKWTKAHDELFTAVMEKLS